MLGNQALACDWSAMREWVWVCNGQATSVSGTACSNFWTFFLLYLGSQVHRAAVKKVFGDSFDVGTYEFRWAGGTLGAPPPKDLVGGEEALALIRASEVGTLDDSPVNSLRGSKEGAIGGSPEESPGGDEAHSLITAGEAGTLDVPSEDSEPPGAVTNLP